MQVRNEFPERTPYITYPTHYDYRRLVETVGVHGSGEVASLERPRRETTENIIQLRAPIETMQVKLGYNNYVRNVELSNTLPQVASKIIETDDMIRVQSERGY